MHKKVCSGRLAFNHVPGYSSKGILCEGCDSLDYFHCLKSIGKNWKVLGPFSLNIEDHLKSTYCNLTETSFLLIAILFSSNGYLVEWTRRLELGLVSKYSQYWIINRVECLLKLKTDCAVQQKRYLLSEAAARQAGIPQCYLPALTSGISGNAYLLYCYWEVCSSNENFCFLAFALIIIS